MGRRRAIIPYGPSETQDWLRCPLFRQLKKTLEPPASLWTPNMLLGTALHAAVAALYRGTGAPFDAGLQVLKKDYVEQEEWSEDSLQSLLSHSLEAAIPTCQAIMASESIVGVELMLLPQYDHTTLDLLTETSEGLIVTDLKWSMKAPSAGVKLARLHEYDSHFQLWCYGYWAMALVGSHNRKEIAWLRVHQVYAKPKAESLLHPIRVTPERMAFWYYGATRAWKEMACEVVPAPNFMSCHGRYGKCQFYDICHLGQGDIEYAKALGYTERTLSTKEAPL